MPSYPEDMSKRQLTATEIQQQIHAAVLQGAKMTGPASQPNCNSCQRSSPIRFHYMFGWRCAWCEAKDPYRRRISHVLSNYAKPNPGVIAILRLETTVAERKSIRQTPGKTFAGVDHAKGPDVSVFQDTVLITASEDDVGFIKRMMKKWLPKL